ncbi:hypothetical protein pdam_00016133 [Pocillopora damicornis]|uniref:Uncharacterized protein n=1 Tax=Pocillopora damicornis TaxID=46731 RepID=A0A3M6UB42_POCDA|nr:hypothetical protein pdam_00016133 [Pocillopora damicornis]
MLAYKVKKNNANALMNEARRKFYHNFIQDNSNSQRHLFSAAKKLLNQGDNRAVYPPVDDNSNLANQLGTFFIQKIKTIGSNFDNMAQGLPAFPDDYAPESPPPLSKFSPITEEKVRKLINSSTNKNCTLDPMPTSLLDCISTPIRDIIFAQRLLSIVSGPGRTGQIFVYFAKKSVFRSLRQVRPRRRRPGPEQAKFLSGVKSDRFVNLHAMI